MSPPECLELIDDLLAAHHVDGLHALVLGSRDQLLAQDAIGRILGKRQRTSGRYMLENRDKSNKLSGRRKTGLVSGCMIASLHHELRTCSRYLSLGTFKVSRKPTTAPQ